MSNVYDPQQLNRYAFERNNPYNNVDTSGHWIIPAALAFIGGVANTISYYAYHETTNLAGAATYFATGALVGLSTLSKKPIVIGLAAVGGRYFERLIDDESVTDTGAIIDYTITGAAAMASFGISKILPQAKYWLIKSLGGLATSKTGQLFMTTEIISQSGGMISSDILNHYYLALQDLLINQLNHDKSADILFGKDGKGYSDIVNGYVTSDGRTYPTDNADWVPPDNAEEICVSGCRDDIDYSNE